MNGQSVDFEKSFIQIGKYALAAHRQTNRNWCVPKPKVKKKYRTQRRAWEREISHVKRSYLFCSRIKITLTVENDFLTRESICCFKLVSIWYRSTRIMRQGPLIWGDKKIRTSTQMTTRQPTKRYEICSPEINADWISIPSLKTGMCCCTQKVTTTSLTIQKTHTPHRTGLGICWPHSNNAKTKRWTAKEWMKQTNSRLLTMMLGKKKKQQLPKTGTIKIWYKQKYEWFIVR